MTTKSDDGQTASASVPAAGSRIDPESAVSTDAFYRLTDSEVQSLIQDKREALAYLKVRRASRSKALTPCTATEGISHEGQGRAKRSHLINEYAERFGPPPFFYGMTAERLDQLMARALARGTPITAEELEEHLPPGALA